MRVSLACFFWRVFLMLGEFSPGLVDILQLDRFICVSTLDAAMQSCLRCLCVDEDAAPALRWNYFGLLAGI